MMPLFLVNSPQRVDPVSARCFYTYYPAGHVEHL